MNTELFDFIGGIMILTFMALIGIGSVAERVIIVLLALIYWNMGEENEVS